MKKTILVSISFLFLFTSCRKFLEQPSYNNVSVDDIFKDFEGARTTLIGLYDDLRSINYYMGDFYLYPDIAGGNIKYSKTSNQRLFFSYAFTRDSINNELDNFYSLSYHIIYGANNVLKYIDRAADATSYQKARMLADAYTIRAMVHFDLVRTFAQQYNYSANAGHSGIVIKTENGSVLTPAGTRASVKEVYDQVVKDIDSAISLYGRSVSIYPTGNAKTWLSADAAKALKNRVNLYRENWIDVISGATELIASNRYPLTTNTQYIASWLGKNISSESIFEIAYGTRIEGRLGDYYNPANVLNGQLAATDDLLNLYTAGDIRGKNTMFVTKNINGLDYYFTRKYQGISDSANDIKLFRISELYLNRAEAYAKSGNLSAAMADLDVIRKRANPAAASFSTASQQALIDEILTERRRELAFEGHLFFDIARNKKNLIRIDCPVPIQGFTYPNPLFAYPIPVYQ